MIGFDLWIHEQNFVFSEKYSRLKGQLRVELYLGYLGYLDSLEKLCPETNHGQEHNKNSKLFISMFFISIISHFTLHERHYSSVKAIFKGWVTYFRDHQQITFFILNGNCPSTKPPTPPGLNRQIKWRDTNQA